MRGGGDVEGEEGVKQPMAWVERLVRGGIVRGRECGRVEKWEVAKGIAAAG
jgi:hypothetical protein